MFGLNWLVSLGAILKDYAQGFTQSEIIARRTEWMLTVWMTVLIFTGFKPFFELLKQGLFLLKEFIFGWLLGRLFKQQKYKRLSRKKNIQEQKIALLETEKKKYQEEIQELLNKNPKLKRFLEEKKTMPEEPTPSLEKKGEQDNE